MRGIVNQVIGQLLSSAQPFTSTDVARAAGVSRQAAHKQLRQLVRKGAILAQGNARARRYGQVVPLRTRLDVASAGSLFRLSARLLLDGVESGELTLDFTGVVDVGEEFLDEIFLVWAPAHPKVTLRISHLPSRFAALLFDLGRRARAMTESDLQAITRTIQLAVAPVFLLSAIAAILNVLSARLGRVVDRARKVEGLAFEQVDAARGRSVTELQLLSRRARLIHIAFIGATCAALLVCLLIAVAFLGYLFALSFGSAVAVLFVLALTAIVVALLFLLREVFLAVAVLQFTLPPDAKA